MRLVHLPPQPTFRSASTAGRVRTIPMYAGEPAWESWEHTTTLDYPYRCGFGLGGHPQAWSSIIWRSWAVLGVSSDRRMAEILDDLRVDLSTIWVEVGG